MLVGLVIWVHFLWILFLVIGFIFVLKRSRIAYLHAAGLLFSLILNLCGWYCPLTHLEAYLHSLQAVDPIRQKAFLVGFAERLVYPDLPETMVRAGEIGFVLANAIAYGWVLKRRPAEPKAGRGEAP